MQNNKLKMMSVNKFNSTGHNKTPTILIKKKLKLVSTLFKRKFLKLINNQELNKWELMFKTNKLLKNQILISHSRMKIKSLNKMKNN